jgi:integrase
MAILQECPLCHKKQATKNRHCLCGADLDRFKKSKKVRYWINYRLPGGKQKREAIGYSIQEARDAHGKRRVQKRENRIFDIKAETTMTFSELSQWYLSLEKVKALASYPQIEIALANFNAVFGTWIIANIKPTDLENYQVLRTKANKSAAYIDNEMTTVKVMLNKAIDNDMLAEEAKRPFKKLKPLLPHPNSNARDRILSPSEYNQLYSCASPHLKAIIATGFYTGMRIGEILNLTWDKVDLKARTITLEATDTKTGEPRKTPICPALYNILNALPSGIGKASVFTYNGKRIKDIKESMRTACKRANIPYGRKVQNGITYHDLRHTFNTYARKAGIDKETIKAITGHASDAMFGRYNKVDSDDIQNAGPQYQQFVDHLVDQGNRKARV